MNKAVYLQYLSDANLPGSGKATSYVRALDLLSEMLKIEAFGFEDCIDIWNLKSVSRLEDLKQVVKAQSKQEASIWLSKGVASSYLLKGYCQAALSSYVKFLAELEYEDDLFSVFNQFEGESRDLTRLLGVEPKSKQNLLEGIKDTDGLDVLRNVKVRVNQNLFRRMISTIYDHSCCITGLNIPQLNRASHIVSWASDPDIRLDPTNGLYLSATYDAAFDSHLISLDEDYRIILAKEIKDHYTSTSVKNYFKNVEGMKINLPLSYKPSLKYLAKHRSLGRF